jgi:hypothetical protein
LNQIFTRPREHISVNMRVIWHISLNIWRQYSVSTTVIWRNDISGAIKEDNEQERQWSICWLMIQKSTIRSVASIPRWILCITDLQRLFPPFFRRKRGFKVLHCTKYHVVFDRDINSTKNMMVIALSIWDEKDRPEIYKPEKEQSTT